MRSPIQIYFLQRHYTFYKMEQYTKLHQLPLLFSHALPLQHDCDIQYLHNYKAFVLHKKSNQLVQPVGSLSAVLCKFFTQTFLRSDIITSPNFFLEHYYIDKIFYKHISLILPQSPT